MARLSNVQIIQIIQKAARRINRILSLTGTDNEIVINSSNGEITSPDDDDLRDLVILQSECMLAGRDVSYELNSGTAGILAKDGEQTLDTRQTTTARSNFFNSDFSPCAELQKQLNIEKIKRTEGYDIW